MADAPITPQEAAAELLHRRRARRSLPYYALAAGLWPGRHHLLMLDRLEAVARGECRRLAIFMPPGSAKSSYASVLFPAWLLAQQSPHGMPWDVIGASHTAGLATDFSRRVRARVRDDAALLGVGLSEDSTALERWETTKGGVYRAVGVGGSVTGRRGDIAVIDDPVKSREEADSEAARRKTWTWYTDDLRSRLKPLGSIVLIMTRWHDDDLAGRILPEEWDGESGRIEARDGETWEVICLPAIADREDDPLGREVGEPIWPEWQPLEVLEQERATLTSGGQARSWSALYQQRPTPESGDYFRREWCQRWTKLPLGVRYFLSSDWAVSTREEADWIVHQVWAVDATSRLYLVDQWRQRPRPDEQGIDPALDLVARYRPACWLGESGVIEAALGPLIQTRMRERNIFCPRELYPRSADKAALARGIQGRMSQGMVYLPEGQPWLADFEAELLRFPTGRHDDQVDAMAMVGLHLDQVVAPPRIAHASVSRPVERMW